MRVIRSWATRCAFSYAAASALIMCLVFELRRYDDTHGALKTGIPQSLCGDNSAEIPMIFGVRPELARNNVLLFKPCRVS